MQSSFFRLIVMEYELMAGSTSNEFFPAFAHTLANRLDQQFDDCEMSTIGDISKNEADPIKSWLSHRYPREHLLSSSHSGFASSVRSGGWRWIAIHGLGQP
jgi:hypothetical protein